MDNTQNGQTTQSGSPVPPAAVPSPAPAAEIVQLEGTPQNSVAPVSSEELLKTPIEIHIALPTQAYFLSGIRDFTLDLTQNLTGFSEQWAFRFQAVVDELCNNAIEHGSAPGKLLTIHYISVKDTSLEVIVEDTGTASEKMTAAQLTQLYRDRKQLMMKQYLGFRGRGLPKIVGEWTDEVIFEDVEGGGIRVRVKKYLRKEDDALSSGKKNDPTHLVLQ